MKKIGLALLYAIIIFFFSLTIAPMIPDIASNYKMNSSNAILFSLIFTVILCTMIVLDKIAEVNEKLDELKKQD